VAHAYNPKYIGGRNQEDCGWSQPREIVHETLAWKNPLWNRAGGMAQGIVPEFKLQYCKKKKKKKAHTMNIPIQVSVWNFHWKDK
jgi:hypothetical protein